MYVIGYNLYISAIIDSGIGWTQFNGVMTQIGLRGMTHKTLKKREREMGKAIRHIAESSVDKAIQEEIRYSFMGGTADS